MYPELHTRKDGSAINDAAQVKMDKMKELSKEDKNRLKSSDTSDSIAWSKNYVFVQVMGKERKCRVRGVVFGPSLNGESSNGASTNSQTQVRDDKVVELTQKLAAMEEKLACFDEMKQRLSQFEEMEQRMSQFQAMEQRVASMH